MQKVGINTSQNVLIDYEVASIGDRIAAFLIDIVILIAYGVAIIFIHSRVITIPDYVFFILMLPNVLYHLLCEIFFNGQSLGKRQMNIKVVKLDGSSPSIGNYLLRWILRPVDISMFSGAVAILSILLSPRSQRLGDMAAGTAVVKYQKSQLKAESHIFKPVEEEYEVVFPQVNKLRDEDIALIQEAIKVYRTTANPKPVQIMADKVKAHLKIESDMPPVKLLNVVLKDYNYITSRS